MKIERVVEADVSFGLGSNLKIGVDFTALPVDVKRSIFSALLRDGEVVTANWNSPAFKEFEAALEKVCKWEKYKGVK